jgi:SAM-dependent methyltransferase
MSNEFHQEFDVVSAFHLLEHLERPRELFETAATILQPGGRLFVSVPNSQRLIIDRALLPLDWPPHHLTRWTPESLRFAGERWGFTMSAVFHEPTHACYRRLSRLPGPLAVPIAGAVAYTRGGHINWSAVRRDGGWLRSGHSVLAVFSLDSQLSETTEHSAS